MPRRPRFRTAAFRELFDGLRYAPVETIERQMLAAEGLTFELEPFSLYGRDDVLRRVTGFRPESRDDGPPSLVGQALLSDLSSLIERLSERLALRADQRPGGALPLEAAAARLGVSHRSLLRYRAQGLVVHWIDFDGTGPDGATHARRRVGCYIEALDRFRARRLEAAPRRRPRRPALSESTRLEILRSAETMLRDQPLPLHRAAAVVAERHAIDVRSARAVLAGSTLRIDRRRRRSFDDVRLAYRAWRRGVEPARIEARLGRDHAACWRAINTGRIDALRAIELPEAPALATFEHPEAADVLLAPPSVRRGLAVEPEPTDAIDFLRSHAPMALPPRAGESDACRRLVAMRFLLWRARRGIKALRAAATGAALDRLETDLRNAWLLRRTLLSHALPSALGRVEAAIGGRIEHLPAPAMARVVTQAIVATASSLDSADGADAAEGRLRVARHAALVMDRELAIDAPPALASRAAAVHRRAAPLADDPDLVATPWAAILPYRFAPAARGADPEGAETDADEPNSDGAADRGRALLERRYGWDGGLASTLHELARAERTAPSLLQRRLLDAAAALRRR